MPTIIHLCGCMNASCQQQSSSEAGSHHAAWLTHTQPGSFSAPVPCSPNDNQYAHPIDMVPIVDLNLRKVVHIDRWGE